ncbi:Isoquinoline 1-oxidoreductase subunit alpha [Serratia proteamaculans]|uniref:(2Fe-2S)-binding protein n=1 Tax=Serratia proteamaculans TaxID=28151 RepID=A0ABS0TKR9_SERPR|nr:(2Fe-2S)-binding protein [Serratia proteamaculans]KAB1496671.1 (2Fe-2S)-binding protein [Serratia proteamaculans]MBI6178956.1 (2Fe-2S)-binding protein [Serratia proteamaculans]RYM51667.1 (2Fe-2S)-binding protein [Serratia proteamaculans]RYM54196.1 (2Fe-2S)-binding protein [Serratia proteamaculans]CAI0772280.1 Isoquinoline 1-oxidoreductase subunit alpha [Serratia proteamaculans]
MKFNLNGHEVEFDGEPDTPLLWVIREHFKLTGTKFGCGIGACGACTVHVDGQAVRSCCYPLQLVVNRKVTTIEGLSADRSHPVQQAWIAEDVPQCGYCQSGMIMAVSALLAANPHPSDRQIDDGLTNLCRCATYHRIRSAVHRVSNGEK